MDSRRPKPVVCPRNVSFGRTAFTLFLLLAFALQSFVVQTHIHFSAPGFAGGQESLVADRAAHSAVSFSLAGDSDKNTKDGDPERCPLCQAVLLGGYYLIPAPAQIHLPLVYAILDPVGVIAVFAASSPSHAWHSRAPPII